MGRAAFSAITRDSTLVSNLHFPVSVFEFRLLLLPFAFCDLPFELFFLKGVEGHSERSFGALEKADPEKPAYWYLGALAARPQRVEYYHLGYSCE
jgi:hypothetical protein